MLESLETDTAMNQALSHLSWVPLGKQEEGEGRRGHSLPGPFFFVSVMEVSSAINLALEMKRAISIYFSYSKQKLK
jgi:hypothetical protein